MNTEKLLPVSVVSKRLNISISYVYRLIELEELPAVKIGFRKGIRVKSSDVSEFLDKKRVVL